MYVVALYPAQELLNANDVDVACFTRIKRAQSNMDKLPKKACQLFRMRTFRYFSLQSIMKNEYTLVTWCTFNSHLTTDCKGSLLLTIAEVRQAMNNLNKKPLRLVISTSVFSTMILKTKTVIVMNSANVFLYIL